jgi:hypothetical protein
MRLDLLLEINNNVNSIRKIFSLFLFVGLSGISYTQNYLQPNEKIQFEFRTNKDKKLVIAQDTNENYLVYRYGTIDSLELEFPENLNESWSKFKFTWYLRGGGIQNEGMDLNYLYFDSGMYRYVVFSEYIARSGKTEYGIKVINLETNKKFIIKAIPKSVKGSLFNFRELEKLKEGDVLFLHY